MHRVWNEGIQAFLAGNFPAPFGIALVADLTSVGFVLATSLAALAVLYFSFFSLERQQEEHYFYAAFQFLLVGVNGSFLTGDIFNLFVFFELMLVASYLLIALGGRRMQLRETLKYALINNAASGFFLLGVAGLYRTYGTLNMADLAVRIGMSESNGWLSVIAVVFWWCSGSRQPWCPFTSGCPDRTSPGRRPLSLSSAASCRRWACMRCSEPIRSFLWKNVAFTHQHVLLPLALITMVIGIIGAIAQTDFKSILSFHIVSQIGYMLMGIAMFTPLAIAGTIIFVLHQMVVKSVLFLCAGAAEQVTGTSDLRKMSGLLTTHGSLAGLFLVAALALIGVPPLSGFFGKLTLVQAGIQAEHFFSVAVALAVGSGTLFSMIKIFRLSFWGECGASG